MSINGFFKVLSTRVKCYNTVPVKLLLISATLLLFAFAPRDTDPLVRIVAVLQKWTDTIPQEKVYLQTDKPYYALGDTIWFKGYVTIGSRHQLSALSGALYVELITEKDSIIRSLKLPITSGMVMGDFTLGDDFKEGSYRLRAYTQWMRNAGEDYFFDRTFTVGNLVSYNIVAKADYQYKNIDGKQVLTATLNYVNDEGKPIANKNIDYQIFINKKAAWTGSAKTDAAGNITVNVPNDNHADLGGAYIHTSQSGNDKYPVIRDLPIKANLAQSDVQFFPESGNLVNGISSRVAFKAVGVNGLGTPITGKIVDETSTEVAPLITLHAGMGSFILRPLTGKTYTANISFADGTTKTLTLPKAIDEGYVLSVYQPNKDSVLVRIRASVVRGQNVSFIVHSSGETIFSSPVKVTNAITSVWLNKQSFPTGIAQFTLFNSDGEPLNERIAFIRANDQMQLNLKTARGTYKSKEHVQIELDATDSKGKGVPGNFSVTVIDESKVPVDESAESTILSNILLTADLKGYVEKPNYYFTKETDEVNRALDNLMLTQGYRRFTWKELENTVNTKPAFEVEGLGFKVSGLVTTLGNKPVPNANVMLMSVKAGVMKGATSDENGRFKFDGIFLTDSVKFAVQARTGKNSDKVKIILDSIPKIKIIHNKNIADVSTNVSGTIKAYLESGKKEDDIYESSGQLDKVHRLREVRIRARKPAPSPYAVQGGLKIPQGHADQEIIMKDAENAANLSTYLAGILRGAIFKERVLDNLTVPMYPYVYDPEFHGYVPLGIILDGRALSPIDIVGVFDNTTVDITDIVKIDVVKSNLALKAMLGGGAALLIYTKRDKVRKSYNPSMANITPKGFNKAREFYSPRYDRPGNANKLPDLRTTIYWNPYLKTDANGKTTFNFFNADGPGTYKVIVEGINAAGELGRQVYRYTVDGDEADAATFSLPAADKSLAQITAPLDSFNRRLPVEKLYLHTDKPYYDIGDTLWFKSYLLDRVNLTGSRMSGLLYVELDNDSSEMVRRISIPIKDGLGWGQIPLIKAIFREGGYTLRAYTNWMQNFGEDYVFSQRFYLGVPAEDAWLVKSAATVSRVADKDQLQVDLKLNRADKLASPVALRKIEVRIYDQSHYLYKEELQTGIDGSLKFSHTLKEKADGRRIRVQLTSLEKADNNKVVQVPLSIKRNQNIDVQFLPEGGNLVIGLRSVVGFKAIGEDGRGTPVLGAIYDSKGVEVVQYAAIHNGMGSFEFTPKTGETYTARISQPIAKTFVLPKINPAGTLLHVSNPEQWDNLKVVISASNNITTDSACYLIGTSRGVVYYSQKVKLNQAEIAVAKKLFPSGIARFTLFKGQTPLNERIVFIDNNDGLKIKVIPNKTAYLKRDSVGLEIEVKDKIGSPVKGSFSMAVTDDSQVKADSLGDNGIAANLLINADLRGHVESPGYYINRTDKQAWQALDNLMLTQGWTGYDWKDVFTPAAPPKFEAEKEFKITGRVTSLTKKPVANATVLISSRKPSFLTTAYTDADGRYTFKNLPAIDSGSFFLQGTNGKGKPVTFGNLSVDKFKPPGVPLTIRDQVLPWYVNTDSTQINYVKRVAQKANEENIKLTGNVLKEVKIKDRKIIKDSMNPFGPGEGDLIFDEQDIKKSATINLYELLMQKVPELQVFGARPVTFRDGFMHIPMLGLRQFEIDLRIDGRPVPLSLDVPPTPPAHLPYADNVRAERPIVLLRTDRDEYYQNCVAEVIEQLSEYKTVSLKGLEITWSRKYTNRLVPQPKSIDIARIDITTTNGNGWYRDVSPGTATYRPLPIMRPQQFYSPKYNVAPGTVIEPDYRATLYWEPNIVTDQNGKAKVYFYTSDIINKYTIKIAGVDITGAIGDGTFKIKN